MWSWRGWPPRSRARATTGAARSWSSRAPPGWARPRSCAARARRRPELTVLRASGSELEHEFGFGIVRQLFERSSDLDGVLSAGGDRFATLHGLYWLVADLAEERPLLLCVDDAQWADDPSLRFLAFLARRVAELPITLVIAARPPLPGEDRTILETIAAEASTLSPAPLSETAIATLAGPGADPAFITAVHEATAGNALLVEEVLAEARERPLHTTGIPGPGPGIQGAYSLDASAERIGRRVGLRLAGARCGRRAAGGRGGGAGRRCGARRGGAAGGPGGGGRAWRGRRARRRGPVRGRPAAALPSPADPGRGGRAPPGGRARPGARPRRPPARRARPPAGRPRRPPPRRAAVGRRVGRRRRFAAPPARRAPRAPPSWRRRTCAARSPSCATRAGRAAPRARAGRDRGRVHGWAGTAAGGVGADR